MNRETDVAHLTQCQNLTQVKHNAAESKGVSCFGGRRPAGQSARSMPPSTGSITPETNEAAGESRNAAARPNSSGLP